METLVEGKGGCRRKGKRKMRDEAVEEGYITRAQRETTGPERKRKQGGQARLVEISCADLVWKMRIVTFISSSFGQSLGCLFLYEHPIILLLPPVH